MFSSSANKSFRSNNDDDGSSSRDGFAITTTMLTNPYAGIIVLASTPGIEDLTVAQTTIWHLSFCLHIQSLLKLQFHEAVGLSVGATIIIRILSGILFCTY